MPRTETLRIVGDRPAKVLSVLRVAALPPRGRLLPRSAYLSANATYKHQFNVWNLSKWISPGSCLPRTTIFLSAANAILMWNIAVLLRGAREEYQVGRFPLLLFQDNPFERQAASYVTREIRLHQSAALYSFFSPPFWPSFLFNCRINPRKSRTERREKIPKNINRNNLTRLNNLIMMLHRVSDVVVDSFAFDRRPTYFIGKARVRIALEHLRSFESSEHLTYQ